MKNFLLVSLLLVGAVGCRKAAQHNPGIEKPSSPKPSAQPAEWMPLATGATYQLALRDSLFSFCDDGGPHVLDVRTGKQTVGAERCDPKKETIQSACDNDVEISGDPAQPFDVLSFEGDGYPLNGHSRGCDRDGHIVAITTASDVEIVDAAANKKFTIDAEVPDQIVIGSGWLAWNSLDKKVPLRLETVAHAVAQGKSTKESSTASQ